MKKGTVNQFHIICFVLRSRGTKGDHPGGEISYCGPVCQTGASAKEKGQTASEISEEL